MTKAIYKAIPIIMTFIIKRISRRNGHILRNVLRELGDKLKWIMSVVRSITTDRHTFDIFRYILAGKSVEIGVYRSNKICA